MPNEAEKLDQILVAIEERQRPQASHKQVYQALTNYMKNELGINAAYFEKFIRDFKDELIEKVTLSVTESLIKLYLSEKRFNSGGWTAAINKAVESAAKEEVEKQLRAGIKISVSMKDETNV